MLFFKNIFPMKDMHNNTRYLLRYTTPIESPVELFEHQPPSSTAPAGGAPPAAVSPAATAVLRPPPQNPPSKTTGDGEERESMGVGDDRTQMPARSPSPMLA